MISIKEQIELAEEILSNLDTPEELVDEATINELERKAGKLAEMVLEFHKA